VDVTVEAMAGFFATIVSPGLEESVFTDRTYIFDSLGSFSGYSYVRMANEDKHIRDSHVQMKLRFTQPTIVYVVKLDDTEFPRLAAEGWVASSLTGVSYSGIRETPHTDWLKRNWIQPSCDFHCVPTVCAVFTTILFCLLKS